MSLVGQPAPAFCLKSTKNLDFLDEDVSLGDYRGRWLVLLFYPLDFTFVCPTEIMAFSRRAEEFRALGADLLAVSTDSVYSHQAWIEFVLGPVAFPLASDLSKEVSRAYGVLDEEAGVARRGLFIVDPGGVVRHEVVHDEAVGRSVDETLRVLRALRTGELCPADWQPGAPTLVRTERRARQPQAATGPLRAPAEPVTAS